MKTAAPSSPLPSRPPLPRPSCQSNQDMTLATTRAALRKIRAELRASLTSEAGKNGSLVILSSATSNVLYLRELLLPGRVSPPPPPPPSAPDPKMLCVVQALILVTQFVQHVIC